MRRRVSDGIVRATFDIHSVGSELSPPRRQRQQALEPWWPQVGGNYG